MGALVVPAGAGATTTVVSVPGQVAVLGDGQSQDLVIKESQVDLEDPNRQLIGYLGVAVPLSEASEQIVIAVEERALPAATAESLTSYILGLLTLLPLLEGDGRDERDNYRTLLIHQYSADPLDAVWPCSRRRYSQEHAGTATVGCPLMHTSLGISPDLFVWTGDGDDRVRLKLHCATCTKERVVWGGKGDDTIDGSRFYDFLAGDLGDDVIRGFGSRDFIWGYKMWSNTISLTGTDSDRLFGGAGNDAILGQWDNDLVSGGEGNDLDGPGTALGIAPGAALQGGEGDDAVVGGSGVDAMEGGPGRDSLLAKESDLGFPEERDYETNCAGPGISAVPGEDYRRSPQDDVVNCESEISSPVTRLMLSAWSPGLPWPWRIGL